MLPRVFLFSAITIGSLYLLTLEININQWKFEPEITINIFTMSVKTRG